ncbi:Flagellar hook-associated protein FlgL [hydrothermal vent metagenome]|uniref:Flagellar hook-associated protein FlgL n=1 Tax=hydrothermal vent metagenome TaxID=652676 RepID=A0A3B0ZM21_9ZZZZ
MTVRLSTSMMFQNSMKTMMENQSEINRLQQQIATGKRLLSAADDPAASSAVLQLREAKQQMEQYQLNADAADAQVGYQESVYGNINNVLQRVRDLTLQGNSDTTNQNDRAIIAEEIDGLRRSLISIANSTDVNGDYMFAGNKAGSVPFVETGNVMSYQGDEGVRELKVGASRLVALNDNGKDVFMKIPTGNGVISASANVSNTGTGIIDLGNEVGAFVNDTYSIQFTSSSPMTYEVYDSSATLVAGPSAFSSGDALSFAGINVSISGEPNLGDEFTLEPSGNADIFSSLQAIVDVFNTTGDDSASSAYRHNEVSRAFGNLDNAMENINVKRSQAGNRLNAIEQQRVVNDNLIFQGTVNISRLEDVDMAEAIMNFQMQLQALEASQQSFSIAQRRSLFDFM